MSRSTMPTHSDIVGPISGLLTRARNSGIRSAAAIVQGKLDELTASGASEDTRTSLYELVREVFAANELPLPDAPIKTVTTVQRETRATLALHVSPHTWTQLTTEQKGCFADAIDAEWDFDPESTKTDRWWRD